MPARIESVEPPLYGGPARVRDPRRCWFRPPDSGAGFIFVAGRRDMAGHGTRMHYAVTARRRLLHSDLEGTTENRASHLRVLRRELPRAEDSREVRWTLSKGHG